MTDTELLDSLERFHTLHYDVTFTYIVTGFLATFQRDGNSPLIEVEGKTVRDALRKIVPLIEAYVNEHKLYPLYQG